MCSICIVCGVKLCVLYRVILFGLKIIQWRMKNLSSIFAAIQWIITYDFCISIYSCVIQAWILFVIAYVNDVFWWKGSGCYHTTIASCVIEIAYNNRSHRSCTALYFTAEMLEQVPGLIPQTSLHLTCLWKDQ